MDLKYILTTLSTSAKDETDGHKKKSSKNKSGQTDEDEEDGSRDKKKKRKNDTALEETPSKSESKGQNRDSMEMINADALFGDADGYVSWTVLDPVQLPAAVACASCARLSVCDMVLTREIAMGTPNLTTENRDENSMDTDTTATLDGATATLDGATGTLDGATATHKVMGISADVLKSCETEAQMLANVVVKEMLYAWGAARVCEEEDHASIRRMHAAVAVWRQVCVCVCVYTCKLMVSM